MDQITDIEQLEKRVEWLDNERRNDKTNLASLQNRLTVLEGENIALRKQLKELEMNDTRLANQLTNMDKYDNRIDRLNIDLTKQIRDVSERSDLNLSEAQKRLKLEIDANRKSLAELVPLVEQLDALRNEQKTFKVEDSRLARLIEELKVKIEEVGRFDEDYRRSLHLLEENDRQEAKRFSDLQGEIVSLRKRLEETRSRFDSFSDSFRTLDMRIAELQAFEKDRLEAQSTFMDRVNNSLVEKDKIFKGWEKRFNDIDKINLDLTTQMENLETARQAVSKATAGLDDVTKRIDRRINEISEVQRLNDERFRQEWNTFKADDLKRWTSYMLTQEEQTRTVNQELTNTTNQIQAMNDQLLQTRDELDRLSRETVKHIQSVLMTYQESIQTVAPLLDKKVK